MKPADEFVAELALSLPEGAKGDDGRGVSIYDVEVTLPIETRVGEHGLSLSTPRGRLSTGFDPPLGTLRVHFGQEGDG